MFDLHVHHHRDYALERILKAMSQQLDELTAQVAANNTVVGSALTLIQGLAAKLADAGTDPAKLAELAASLKASDDALSAAVAANTPAAPVPTPAPAPAPVDGGSTPPAA